MTHSDTPLCVFSAQVKSKGDSFSLKIPEREVSIGPLQEGEVYRFALMGHSVQSEPLDSETVPSPDYNTSVPPVSEGESLQVEIEDIGDQGDGIARIESGYIVFVPNTTLNERVTIEITEARENVAFAEVIGRQDRFD